jgi:hypothetical protein
MTHEMIKFVTLFLILLTGCQSVKTSSSSKLGQENQASIGDAKQFELLLANAVSVNELEKKDVSGVNLFFLKESPKPFSGYYKVMYEFGNPKMLCQINDGQMHGDLTFWYKNGKVKMRQEWKNSQMNGNFISYREDGSRLSTVAWENGKKIKDDSKLNSDGTISEWPLILNDHTPGPHQPQTHHLSGLKQNK